MTHRIVIIEPSELIQTGLKTALENSDQLEIVATISDTNRLNEKLAPLRANIILINPALVEHHSRSQITTLLPDNAIVIAIAYNHIENTIYDQFSSIIDIFDPLTRIEEKIKESIEKRITGGDDLISKDQYDLSDREKDILVAAVKGQTNKEISLTFNISIHTVISHRKNITRKTGIKSLSGLTVYALLNNLTNPNEIK